MAKYFKWPKQSWWEKQSWRHHTSRFHKATKINQCGTNINRDILANGTRNPHLYDQLIISMIRIRSRKGQSLRQFMLSLNINEVYGELIFNILIH